MEKSGPFFITEKTVDQMNELFLSNWSTGAEKKYPQKLKFV